MVLITATQTGAQVIPVMDSLSAEELNRTLHSINGMLIPGGGQVSVTIIGDLFHVLNSWS